MEEGMSSHPPSRLGGGAQGGAGSESRESGAGRRAGRACHGKGGEWPLGLGVCRSGENRSSTLSGAGAWVCTGKGGWLAGEGV